MSDKQATQQARLKPVRKTGWFSGLLWISIFALTIITMGWVTRLESDQTLHQDAELTAQRWTRAIAGLEAEPERLFGNQALDPQTRLRLSRLNEQSGVFGFWLFDLGGKLVRNSNEAGQPGTARQSALGKMALPAMDGPLRTALLGGLPQTQISRAAIANGPQVYAVVDVAVLHQGRPIGLARIVVDETQRADAADEGLLRIAMVVSLLLAAIGALALYQHLVSRRKQHSSDAHLRYLAAHDALSGALNRASLIAALTREVARSGSRKPAIALLRIDLDRFKDINDAFGHAIGDAALKATTERLAACLGSKDKLARLEGDEFAILLVGPGSREAVLPIARAVQHALAQPMDVSGHHVRCNGSTGIALPGDAAVTADELMSHAELALFRAKSGGRGNFVFHDPERDREVIAQRALTRDLRTALAQGELSVYYQPLFDNDGQTLVGYEALLRWCHAAQGDVPPAVFVPLAEAAELIDEIGLWVLRQACSDASQWPGALSVAVNLSANQFASGALVRQVARALADAGLEADRLCLEITESVLLNNSEQVMKTLRKLGALGVSIAMDDFGTGFSSLAYLWRFPFDKIKIDQVFTKNMVDDPKVAMIVRSIVMLAHSLEIRINAEGVETVEQLALLQDLGCHELQGFLLGRPGPVASLSHAGHDPSQGHARPRGESRESLFATIAMDLPHHHHG